MPKPITPLLAADIIIELTDFPDRPIVLIERAYSPYGWAIPGGFVDLGEMVEYAAMREAKEEVGLEVQLQALLGIYSDPPRDTRGHTVTAVYVAEASGLPEAADDAKNCRLFSLNELPESLAFDHAQVLADYTHYRQTGRPALPRNQHAGF
ncbi:7,8-dihydro-8-oxoguanine triphosphatase [Candidatus Methylobacter favarea]|uniref:7,8-dihydro-8-oxoguanine triphosphatase n=1 Tax=Candidatus Methylobacter favarea TaxID=2707345 RepID=A0A8S0X2S4_9GAMM|nr:NUDIX hydrolase [Candidatus Methylobacter favarea]CAA9892154.1 7,8-dihydro-8-oxoguanine triphosphatase [Candidatus Methylobacter favarea]